MNDFELNKAIAELVIDKGNISCYPTQAPDEVRVHVAGIEPFIVDYCNNWSDLMPLVVEHGIAFGQISYTDDAGNRLFQAGRWTLPFEGLESFNKESHNPQRALAECLLLVLQAKEA